MRTSVGAFVACSWLLSGGAWAQAANVQLAVVSTAPSRPHFVAAGAATTFVVSAQNPTDAPATVTLRIQGSSGSPGDWQNLIFPADPLFRPVGTGADQVVLTIPAQQTARVVARLAAHASLAEGAEGRAVVTASLLGSVQDSLQLTGRVRNRPKVYYVAIDGCGRGYLDLNRKGTRFDGTGERLMPRASAFAAVAARMSGASSVLPAVTDPNHTAALTGSWAGTSGTYQVNRQYMGEDDRGRPVMADESRGMLRWGADGQRVTSMFDVGKDAETGGSPLAFTAIVTGKSWLGDLYRDDALDLVVHGQEYPSYVPPPQPYRLGDPPSDDNANQDREGVNLGPWVLRHLVSPESQLIGIAPANFPDDRWVGEATVRVIQAEDPDVLYVDLASGDEAQHIFGAADRPEEWSDSGTPNVLWDDENVYNANANRDPVLDVVHEADADFGMIADTLSARQAIGRSFVVLLSDHGMTTAMNAPGTVLDPGQILLDGGISESDVERIANRGELAHIALRNPGRSAQAESILESYQVFDPIARTMVNPFVVITRAEMDSGIDDVLGPFARNGVAGDGRGELYSEWNIDVPVGDNSKIRWPDLFLFTRNHFRTQISNDVTSATEGPALNGVHGARASAEVVLVASGPGIQAGVYPAPASLADIAPTLYHLLGVAAPANVDGRVLEEILAP